MATALFYFSGTGNSFWVAQKLGRMLEPADVVAIPAALQSKPIAGADVVGFIFPVYMFGPPVIVEHFARQLPLERGTYVFGVVTHGGAPGGTLLFLDRILRGRDLGLSAGFTVRMPGNYIPLYDAPSADKLRKTLDAAQARVVQIAKTVRQRNTARFKTVTAVIGFLLTRWVRPVMVRKIPELDRGFWVLPACDGCGLCSRICPVGNIRLEGGKPLWSHRCEQCMACLQWCPREAIQFGRRTAHRRRYHHPEVRAGDLVSGLRPGD